MLTEINNEFQTSTARPIQSKPEPTLPVVAGTLSDISLLFNSFGHMSNKRTSKPTLTK